MQTSPDDEASAGSPLVEKPHDHSKCGGHGHGKTEDVLKKRKYPTWEQKRLEAQEKNRKALCKLVCVTLLTFVFMSVEIVGGYFANSIAIMSDAAHLFSDVIGIGFSVIGLIIAQRNASRKYSWGFHRAEVFGALLSIFSIWIITGFLVAEAIHRFWTRPEVVGETMFVISVVCLVFNLIQMKILHSGDHMHGPAHGQCNHDHGHGHSVHDHDHDGESSDDSEHEHHHHGCSGHSHAGHSHDNEKQGAHCHAKHEKCDHNHKDSPDLITEDIRHINDSAMGTSTRNSVLTAS